MTMLAMWLGTTSVALATDSQMTGDHGQIESKNVQKLHCIQSGRVMFGVGFGEGAFEWLRQADCTRMKHPYPEHWRDCSQAEDVDALESIVRRDLQTGGFPTKCHFERWAEGISAQGALRAFILHGNGDLKEISPGSAVFNETSKQVTQKGKMAGPLELLWAQKLGAPVLWQPEIRFWHLKREKDNEQIVCSGAEALKETCEALVNICERSGNPYIGGELQYNAIKLEDQCE